MFARLKQKIVPVIPDFLYAVGLLLFLSAVADVLILFLSAPWLFLQINFPNDARLILASRLSGGLLLLIPVVGLARLLELRLIKNGQKNKVNRFGCWLLAVSVGAQATSLITMLPDVFKPIYRELWQTVGVSSAFAVMVLRELISHLLVVAAFCYVCRRIFLCEKHHLFFLALVAGLVGALIGSVKLSYSGLLVMFAMFAGSLAGFYLSNRVKCRSPDVAL